MPEATRHPAIIFHIQIAKAAGTAGHPALQTRQTKLINGMRVPEQATTVCRRMLPSGIHAMIIPMQAFHMPKLEHAPLMVR